MTEITFATHPEVTLLAKNEVTPEGIAKMLDFYGDAAQGRDYDPSQAELAEFAGRKCYDASGRKNEKTATSYGYLGNILSQVHHSVVEHTTFTFLITDISRAASHELVRHRHFSYSQQSQRYVLLENGAARVVIPPAILKDPVELNIFTNAFDEAWELYNDTFASLKAAGLKKKQAAEAARAYIPNAAATELVLTGNGRAFLEFLQKRDSAAADAEMRNLAKSIGGILADEFPEVFGPRARSKFWTNSNEQKGPKN